MAGLGAYLRLIRPANSLMIGLAVIVGEVVAVGYGVLADTRLTVLGFLSGFLVCSSVMVLNDYFDIEIDRINAPDRPLASGEASPEAALALSAATGLLGVALAALLGPLNLAIAAAFWCLGAAYNWRVKRTGLPGNAIVSASVAIPFVYGAAACGEVTGAAAAFALLAFLSNMGREVAKGIADVEGDAARGVRSAAVAWGPGPAAAMASAFTLAAVAISALPPMAGIVGPYYLPPVIAADAVFVYAVARLLRDPSPASALRVKRLMLAAMALGLIAFLAGAAQP